MDAVYGIFLGLVPLRLAEQGETSRPETLPHSSNTRVVEVLPSAYVLMNKYYEPVATLLYLCLQRTLVKTQKCQIDE